MAGHETDETGERRLACGRRRVAILQAAAGAGPDRDGSDREQSLRNFD